MILTYNWPVVGAEQRPRPKGASKTEIFLKAPKLTTECTEELLVGWFPRYAIYERVP